ncbi:DnaJ C-terminal domain-containing protein [Arenibaculum pallidiluteum]|uniref:DnaJ C-terminal domain-containing protein n=1 Tax=Arenibaculum pallidiluteum TaxID=2812559 RepID=UPI001A966FD4|nr:J domain-containing protein [Arenibaculum pallidiluteum]
MKNPYEVLGVAPSATEDEIRKAYRKLAKRFHPDLNQGQPEAERRFKEIGAAYDLLSDAEKRQRFDRGEIDAEGNELHPGFAGFSARGGGFGGRAGDPFGQGAYGGAFSGGQAGEIDLEELLGGVFGSFGRRAGSQASGPPRQPESRVRVEVDFVTAARGGTRRLVLEDGRALDVAIPPGTEDGTVLRLRGQGARGGDVLADVRVAPHRLFRRIGDDIHMNLPVTLREAVLGGRVRVPTLGKPVMLAVPPGSDGGTVLRLRGKGVHRRGHEPGDQIVTLRIVLGPEADAALKEFLEGRGESGFDPRQGLES